MKITKLRVSDDNGLVPAGLYFKQLAAGLRDANARETARRETADAEDARVEARYRRTIVRRSSSARELAAAM